MSREPGEESPVATSPDADGETTSGRPAHDRPWPSTTGLARAMAMLSLGCSVLLLVLVVAFLVRNGIYVALGLGGVVLGVASGWWVVTGRDWKRVMGWVGLGAGAVLIISAFARGGA